MDFKRALEFVTRDPDWMKKCFMAGLPILVPIAGPIAFLGWQRRVFDNVRQNQESLPDPAFMDDLKYGVDPFIAMLNPLPVLFVLVLVLFGVPAVLMAVGGSIGGDAGGALAMVGSLLQVLAMLVWFVVVMVFSVISPELVRRGFHGERFPLLSPRASIAPIMANKMPYVMAILAAFVGNLVGGLGFYVCCVGLFLTMPAGKVFYVHMLAQWDETVGRDGRLD